MKKIVVFDTSVSSSNLGDSIIMDSVNKEIHSMFPESMHFNAYTHDKISKPTYNLVSSAHYAFVGGSNLLSSNMNSYNQWKINLYDSLFLNSVVLMGVGWWQYQVKPNLYTHYLLKSILHDKILHSVRDSYTEKMLKSIGIDNVVNTSCPTMWNLTQEHCDKISKEKAENVVVTLTDYNKDPSKDRFLIELLSKNYKNVSLWPQGAGDLKYINDLDIDDFAYTLPPNLKAFDNFLENQNSLDYVGTRLHAGIRALQKGIRTIIIGIDNRASEKSKDFNITICERGKLNQLNSLINGKDTTQINLPVKNIERWKAQFL